MRPYVGVIIASFLLLGCAPTPADVCDKLGDLGARPERCESKFEVMRAEEKDVYKKTWLCIKGATHQHQAQQCLEPTTAAPK